MWHKQVNAQGHWTQRILLSFYKIYKLVHFSMEVLLSTWNKTKWIRWRTNWGQLNQKYLSEPCTSGIPWTTACLSVISRAIFVRTAWSFVPTAKTICNRLNSQDLIFYINLEKTFQRKLLTTKGIMDAQNIACHPERGKIFC